MAITLKEIARMAGVSTTSVSRVLNNKAEGNMSQETMERIRKIIELTGYSPNPVASSLRSGSSKVIGVILPSSTNPYYAQLSSFIENEAYLNEHLIVVCNSNSDVSRERRYIETLRNYRVSGILLCSTGLSAQDLLELPLDAGHYVLLDEEVSGFNGLVVVGDDSSGGRMGAEYLYGLGHRRFLVILGPEHLSSTKNRLEGFVSFLADTPDTEYILANGDYTIQSGFNAVIENQSRLEFTAVFSMNDLMAMGAIHAIQTKGLRVPEDISVVGYDNIFLDPYVSPSITSVSTPLEELARVAVGNVVGNKGSVEASRSGGRLTIRPKIIQRESCQEARR